MRAPSTFQLSIVQSMSKGAVRRTALWLRLWFYFYIIQGFTNAQWKKITYNGQRRNKHFLIVIYHSSLVKGAMNAVNCAMVLKKASISSIFNGQRWTKCAMNILCSYLNWWHNWQLKNRRRFRTLKGSHSMGNGRIFIKSLGDVSFNKDLSNEPNFDRIHLAGQYL